MRVLSVLVLTLVGWITAAPPPQSDPAPAALPQDTTLTLARRKRGNAKGSLPYSNYRPSAGIHRYRYPLYRKRSPVTYDFENELVPEVDYFDYEDALRGPSLFRERQAGRAKKDLMIDDDGAFSDGPAAVPALVPQAYVKKDAVYNLANSPYDLEAMGRLYEMGKRDAGPYDLGAYRRKTPRPSPTQEFSDAIDAIAKKSAAYGREPSQADLRDYLTSAASRYWGYDDVPAAADPLIRRKRDTSVAAFNAIADTTNVTAPQNLSATVPLRYQEHLATDRKKRAFSDHFKWEKRSGLAKGEEAPEKRAFSDYFKWEKKSGGATGEEEAPEKRNMDDYLTREYFKSIARSVGQKKKRMAFAQFHADKRSSGLDEFLNNPTMLQYMQSKLKDAEEEVVKDAEGELKDGGDHEQLLSNTILQLDALERMRAALEELQELQERGGAGAKKRSVAGPSRRKKDEGEEEIRSVRRRMRRGDDGFPSFPGNSREDCPILERILLNCKGVSARAGDHDQAFLGACVKHEICYMCGLGLGVTAHECDAVMSAALERECYGNLDCLGAAGDTFELLGDQSRYDQDGTCTHDPCVRQVLESR